MMAQFEQYIFNFLLSYSGQPVIVYVAIAVLMTAGSFGLPISEEVVIIAAGLIAFFGSNPELYPSGPATGYSDNLVSIPTAALVCFLSVFLSDILVYCLGRFFSKPIQSHKYFHRLISKKKMEKISRLIMKYGYFYPAMLRFIPGLRFPGHFSCGFFRVPFFQFALVDGSAALLTVPSQVVLIGVFGRSIVEYLKEFILGGAVIIVIIIFIQINTIRKKWDVNNDDG